MNRAERRAQMRAHNRALIGPGQYRNAVASGQLEFVEVGLPRLTRRYRVTVLTRSKCADLSFTSTSSFFTASH